MPDQKPNVRVDVKSQPFEFLKRLELRTDCGKQDVIAAYRRRARLAHPDHGGSAEKFHQLRQDYEHALAYVERRRASPFLSMPTTATGKRNILSSQTDGISFDFVRLLSRVAIYWGVVMSFGYFLPITITVFSVAVFCITLLPLVLIGLPRLSPLKSSIAFFLLVYVSLLTYAIIGDQWRQIYSSASTYKLSSADWLIFCSPLFFILLLLFAGIGWMVSLTNKR